MLFTLKRTRDQKKVGNVHFIINYDSLIIRSSTMNSYLQNYKLKLLIYRWDMNLKNFKLKLVVSAKLV